MQATHDRIFVELSHMHVGQTKRIANMPWTITRTSRGWQTNDDVGALFLSAKSLAGDIAFIIKNEKLGENVIKEHLPDDTRWRIVSAENGNTFAEYEASTGAEALNMFENDLGEPLNDDICAERIIETQEQTVKLTIGELRSIIHEATHGSDTTLRTADGKEYSGMRSKIDRALMSYGSSMPERQAILSGQIPISSSAVGSLQRIGAVKRIEKPREPSKRSTIDPWERLQRRRDAVHRKFNAATARFARNWRNFTKEISDTTPEDAASDAALGFFYDYPEWQEWAKVLDMSKDAVHGLVTDLVYDQMIKGKKN